jgi:hypothetical protein
MRWSQNYVLPDGVVEEDGVLRDDADGLPERGLGHLSDVLVVDQNRAFLKLKKSRTVSNYNIFFSTDTETTKILNANSKYCFGHCIGSSC